MTELDSPRPEEFLIEEEDLIIKLNTLLLKVDETVKQNKILELSRNLLQDDYNVLAKSQGSQGNGQPDDLQKVLTTFQDKFREFQNKNIENDAQKERLKQERELAVQQLKNYTNKNPITISQKKQNDFMQRIQKARITAAELNELIRKKLEIIT